MDPQLILLLATIATLAAPLLGFLGVWMGGRQARQSAKEANETTRFTAFNAALEKRLEAAEEKIAALEQIDSEKSATINNLSRANVALSRYIAKLLRVIASHLPELGSSLVTPDPEDAAYITGVLATLPPDQDVE